MIYNTVSIKRVIAKLVRNTRITDSSYLQDCLEWIPEAIDMLMTPYQLVASYSCLPVTCYSAKLPCGLVSIEGVGYMGNRLRRSQSQSDVRYNPILDTSSATPTMFQTDTGTTIYNRLNDRIDGSDLKPVPSNSSDAYYKLSMDIIQLSFESGNVDLYYMKRPCDEDGFPLVPANQNYQEAIYWYLLMKMCEAGFEHNLFDWKHCWSMWEQVYAPRAIAECKQLDVDGMETLYRSMVRLIPSQSFYTDFFLGSESYQGTTGL